MCEPQGPGTTHRGKQSYFCSYRLPINYGFRCLHDTAWVSYPARENVEEYELEVLPWIRKWVTSESAETPELSSTADGWNLGVLHCYSIIRQ